MANTTKYVVVEDTFNDMELAFTFPALINHDHFFNALNAVIVTNNLKVVGAGFYDFKTNEAYGESISLNVKSRERDTLVIQKAFMFT